MNKLKILTALSLFMFTLYSGKDYGKPTEGFTAMGGAYLTFAGKFGGDVSREELNKTTSIEIAGCASGSTIQKYKLVITRSGKQTTIQGSGGTLTEAALKALRSMKEGDTFIFKSMTARLPNGGVVDVWGKPFTLV